MRFMRASNDNSCVPMKVTELARMTEEEGLPLMRAAFLRTGIDPDRADANDAQWAALNDRLQDFELWKATREERPEVIYVMRNQIPVATIDHGRDGRFRLAETREYPTAEAALAAFLKPFVDAVATKQPATDDGQTS